MKQDDDGRAPTGQALASQAQGLGPTGFDPSRIAELLEDVKGEIFEPVIKYAADEIYCRALETAQDYLRDNLDWNLTSHIEMLEREYKAQRERANKLEDEIDQIADALKLNHMRQGEDFVGRVCRQIDFMYRRIKSAEAAIAMEAQRAETGTGSVHDSAARRDRPTSGVKEQSNG